MIKLIDPTTEEFEDVWAKALPQLTKLANKYPNEIDWNPEYLLSCIDGAAAALMACDEGFYIVRDNSPYLDIWVAAAFDGQCNIVDRKMAELNETALLSGFESLTFTTVRRGWDKVAPKAGFDVLSVATTFIYRGLGNEEIASEDSRIGTGEIASSECDSAIH